MFKIKIKKNQVICLEEFKKLEPNSEALLCGHVFHIHCLNQDQELRNKCAVCRETKDNMEKLIESEDKKRKLEEETSPQNKLKRQTINTEKLYADIRKRYQACLRLIEEGKL